MFCWYCHWGWPKPIRDIYDKALDALGGDETPLNYGPAHVVWEDENFDCAESCIEDFDEYTRDLTEEQKKVVMQSLVELAKLPIELRRPPAGYEDDDARDKDPRNFPPPKDWVMVKK